MPAPPCASPLAVAPQQRCALCWPSAAIRFLLPSFTAPQSRALSLFLLHTSPESSSPMRPSGTPSTRRHTMAAACSANFFDFSLKTKNEFVQLKVVKGILLLNAGSECACVYRPQWGFVFLVCNSHHRLESSVLRALHLEKQPTVSSCHRSALVLLIDGLTVTQLTQM